MFNDVIERYPFFPLSKALERTVVGDTQQSTWRAWQLRIDSLTGKAVYTHKGVTFETKSLHTSAGLNISTQLDRSKVLKEHLLSD